MATGCLQGAVDHRRATWRSAVDLDHLALGGDSYTLPSPADAPYSGFPPSGMFVTSVPSRGRDTDECASPFNVKHRFEALS